MTTSPIADRALGKQMRPATKFAKISCRPKPRPTRGRDQPLHVAPADAEDIGRGDCAGGGEGVPRRDLDRVGRVRLHFEPLQQHDVEKRADVAHQDCGNRADEQREEEVSNGQRAGDLLAVDGLGISPQLVVADHRQRRHQVLPHPPQAT